MLDGDLAAPPEKGGTAPNFRPMSIYCGRPNCWMDRNATWYHGGRPRSRPHCAGDPAPLPKKGTQPPIFGPRLLSPNGWMDLSAQTVRPHCVRWGPSSPPKITDRVPKFRRISIVAERSPISATAEHFNSSTYPIVYRIHSMTTES